MEVVIWIILAVGFVGGAILLWRGLRGRPIDDHPLCRKCGFDVLVFLGARHAPLSASALVRAIRAIQLAAVIIGVCAAVEFLAPDVWDNFAITVIQFPRYVLEVLRLPGALVFDTEGNITVVRRGVVAGQEITRVSSLLFAPLIFAFYLLVPFAVSVASIVRGRARTGAHVVVVLIGFALVFTLTRSAIIGALTIGLAGLRFANPGAVRVRYAFVLIIGLLVLGPFGADAGLSARNEDSFTVTATPNPESHTLALRAGFDDLVRNPLGLGPGSARFGGDMAYFQIGIELGAVGMVVFVLLLIRTLRALDRVVHDPSLDPGSPEVTAAVAARLAGMGIAITSLLILAWTEINTGWLFWGLAGAALGVHSRHSPEATAAVPDRRPPIVPAA